MDKTDQPKIKFSRVALTEAQFAIAGEVKMGELNGQYELEMQYGFRFPEPTEMQNILKVSCKNRKHPEKVKISLAVAGHFVCDDPEELKRFAPNAGGVLFPYVRTYIATLTSWGPMNPITLPLTNMTAKALEVLKAQAMEESAMSQNPTQDP